MNYIKQVNRFYELLLVKPLSANAIALYMTLLHINNRCNWSKEFSVANSVLMTFTSMNISAFQRARNSLVQKGYINYEKGKSNIAGLYTIIEFESNYKNHNEQQSEHINKLNKTDIFYYFNNIYISKMLGKSFRRKN